MDTVVLIKKICSERKIPLSRLEKDLGFANGYISQLKPGSIRVDRLCAIADYLGVSPTYLIDGEEEIEKPVTEEDDGPVVSGKKEELMGLIVRLTDEEAAILLAQVKGIILGL